MALPAPEDSADRLREDILRLLAATEGGLSDAEIRTVLADAHPGLRPQKVNLVCRQMAATGELERVGTRPIHNRAVRRGPVVEEAPPVEEALPVEEAPAKDPTPDPVRAAASEVRVPVHDLDLAWSRTVNVAAAVAAWLTRRGATIRTASTDGSAHDLVVTLDGEDVHVEVTGWPPDAARVHPAVAADGWFSAATSAAAVRRRAHPRARVVIALPETRRYRTLTTYGSEDLAAAGTAVGFVDGSGSVRPHRADAPVGAARMRW